MPQKTCPENKEGTLKPHSILYRQTEPVDFRPDDPSGKSPYAQLWRLLHALTQPGDIDEAVADIDQATLDAYEELCYRKLFTGSTHEDFVRIKATDPERLARLIAVGAIDSEAYKQSRNKS